MKQEYVIFTNFRNSNEFTFSKKFDLGTEMNLRFLKNCNFYVLNSYKCEIVELGKNEKKKKEKKNVSN